MVSFFSDLFGPYPFTSFGAVVDDDVDAGYALENQTRPTTRAYCRRGPSPTSWRTSGYGNSVTPARWTDIWLNEGFAVYASLLWDSHRGGPTPRQALEEVYAIPADDGYWSVLPGAEDLFAGAVYSRGALTLQALREEVGDEHFFAILRQWAARGGLVPVTTAEFVALSEQVSGRQLDGLFETWL